ncbi:Hypothetical protein LUCI_4344 [Lucifera butyrica]|uniref:Uncharacterized protein n=1 Tax=Lucifera butyrica TaxID=1351585 RepID=A0A498RJ63_9FIRM|nr:hypothetical protein [Lucifera butyrica]VBB09058.1 Hypothetical protein LUCI_4344 [Lucifera butyrica]
MLDDLDDILCSLQGKFVTLFLDGAPQVTARVLAVEKCAVILQSTSGTTILVPFSAITAVEVFPSIGGITG